MVRWLSIVVLAVSTACAPPPPVPEIAQRVAGDFRPEAQDTETVVAASYVYWAAMDAGRWTEAWGYHAEDYRERLPYTQWLTEVPRLPAETRRPTEIHWLKQAFRVHGPELYAILTWTAPTRKGRIYWRQNPAGQWEIENTERL